MLKNSLQKGCIPQYKGREEIAQESQTAKPGDDDYIEDYGSQMIASCGMWTKSQLNNTTASYVLSDGTILISAYNGDNSYNFAYDINGKKDLISGDMIFLFLQLLIMQKQDNPQYHN